MAEKLHLGCGQKYLPGYVNVDFPPSEHTVMVEGVADVYADILGLSYPAASISEVRLHHVFEHFPRPTACALVASWRSWLAPKGRLVIEVPDFGRTARSMLSPLRSAKKRAVAQRHLFGSHEAPWAVHYDGYTVAGLTGMLKTFGFRIVRTERNYWRGMYNFEVTAEKNRAEMGRVQSLTAARRHLARFQVDGSGSEERLFAVWLDLYGRQVEKSWAKDG